MRKRHRLGGLLTADALGHVDASRAANDELLLSITEESRVNDARDVVGNFEPLGPRW